MINVTEHAAGGMGGVGAERLAPIPPIPAMPRYYADAAARPEWLRSIFNETAADYDRIEAILSLGTGRWYRRNALKEAGLARGMRVADVGTGTGLVAREAVRIVGDASLVVGVDPSEGMLERAREGLGIETRAGRAEAMPLGSGEFDFVTMGYALRHIGDLNAAFGEFARVLKPGGRVCVLEITRPRTRVAAGMMRAHMAVAARVACVGRGKRERERTLELWRYYWETIEKCVPAERVVEALRGAGFVEVKKGASLGVFAEFGGVRG